MPEMVGGQPTPSTQPTGKTNLTPWPDSSGSIHETFGTGPNPWSRPAGQECEAPRFQQRALPVKVAAAIKFAALSGADELKIGRLSQPCNSPCNTPGGGAGNRTRVRERVSRDLYVCSPGIDLTRSAPPDGLEAGQSQKKSPAALRRHDRASSLYLRRVRTPRALVRSTSGLSPSFWRYCLIRSGSVGQSRLALIVGS